jgi:hypothetical protein
MNATTNPTATMNGLSTNVFIFYICWLNENKTSYICTYVHGERVAEIHQMNATINPTVAMNG